MASESGVQPFVTHFQGKTKLTSCDFLKIFREFDKDGRFKVMRFFLPYLEVRSISIALSSPFYVISPVENTVVFF